MMGGGGIFVLRGSSECPGLELVIVLNATQDISKFQNI